MPVVSSSGLNGEIPERFTDAEGGGSPGGEESQNAKEEEEKIRAVLVAGSFSAYVYSPIAHWTESNNTLFSWKSLFFYRCTDEILFAPLKSQGVDSRLNYIRENTVTKTPPPCSPKSIYLLADFVSGPSVELIFQVQYKRFEFS